MGDCNNCKGKCGGGSEKARVVYSTQSGEEDISEFLRPIGDGIRRDATPLEHPCLCADSPKLPRSACLPCIRSWVYAVDFEEVEREIANRAGIPRERLESVLAERKRKEVFEK